MEDGTLKEPFVPQERPKQPNAPQRISYEEAVAKGTPLTKRDLVDLRKAQHERGIFSIAGDDISTRESRHAAAVAIATSVRDKDEKIRCLAREVNAIDAVFDEARKRREEMARKIEAQHQEVLEKIAEVRQQVTVESVRRHKELKEFKKKFDADVEKAHDDFIREVDTRGEEVALNLDEVDVRMDKAQVELDKEREERVEHIRSGTEAMQAKLDVIGVDLVAEQVAREKEEARLLADLQDVNVRALERIAEDSVDIEKRLKRITNEVVKEYKRQTGVQQVHVVAINEEIEKIEQVIVEEGIEREVCQEKLVGNLKDFLDTFKTNIEFENSEKREWIEEMKATMEVKT